MTVQIVPVIYDHTTKKILRWYLLDFDRQLADAAFKPRDKSERMLKVPLQLYKALAGADPHRPLLHKLQDYVNGNAS